MPDVVDEAVENQKRNVELRTGRAFDSWVDLARASGPEKHGELVAWLKSQHGMGAWRREPGRVECPPRGRGTVWRRTVQGWLREAYDRA